MIALATTYLETCPSYDALSQLLLGLIVLFKSYPDLGVITKHYYETVLYRKLNPKMAIIGGGPWGLCVGYNTIKLNKQTNWQIFESNSFCGGLASSVTDE